MTFVKDANAGGNTLFFITASNEAEATEALSALPTPGSNASLKSGLSPPGGGPPWNGVMLVTPLRLPTMPFCVGENANPNNALMYLITDGWMDGDRVIQVVQHGDALTAKQTSGTLTCGAPGLTFTATFSGGRVSQLSGSDLSVCNPPACVSAGLLPNITVVTFSGTVADDEKSIDITWNDVDYNLVYDGDGNLTECNQVSTSAETLTLNRGASDSWRP